MNNGGSYTQILTSLVLVHSVGHATRPNQFQTSPALASGFERESGAKIKVIGLGIAVKIPVSCIIRAYGSNPSIRLNLGTLVLIIRGNVDPQL